MGPSYFEETAAARNVARMLSLGDMMKGRTKSQEGIDIQDPDEPPTRVYQGIYLMSCFTHNTAGLGDPTVMKNLRRFRASKHIGDALSGLLTMRQRHEDSIHACKNPNVSGYYM